MSSTLLRDQASALAKSHPRKALEKARSIPDAWFRAQALSSVARFTDEDPSSIAREAAKTASKCDDDYKRSSVRSWEIAALAERGFLGEARKALNASVRLARTVEPVSSRSEALFLLLQAAYAIGEKEALEVKSTLENTCPVEEHWRCKRAVREAGEFSNREREPRKFF